MIGAIVFHVDLLKVILIGAVLVLAGLLWLESYLSRRRK